MIAALRAFFRLRRIDRELVAEAALLVLLVRAGISVLRFNALRRALTTCSMTFPSRIHRSSALPARVGWAVEAVTRRLPAAPACLVDALAAETMLQRRGFAAALRIGVARASEAPLKAHAWVECGGAVVLGRIANLSDYAVLTASRDS